MSHKHFIPAFLLLILSIVVACKPMAVTPLHVDPGATANETAAEATQVPPPSAPPPLNELRTRAEQRILGAMSPALAEFVRAQPWYTEVTEAEYLMLEVLRDTDRTAQRYGTESTFMDSLRLTTEQGWFHDGFDDNEAKALTALYRAYQVSLDDRHVENIGPLMASSIRGNHFYVLNLPETGEVTLVVAADPKFEHLSRRAIDLLVDLFPKVEAMVGPYPYPFLHVWITDLGDTFAGLSRNEFMWLSPTDVDVNTVSHELTHATLYGLFPTWFEEGFAYFIGYRIAGTLQAYEREVVAALAAARVPRQMDLNASYFHSGEVRYLSAMTQGFLFFKGLSDIQGIEGLGHVVRGLRSKTFNNDNELMRAIVSNSPPEQQAAVQQYICKSVIGLRSGCQ